MEEPLSAPPSETPNPTAPTPVMDMVAPRHKATPAATSTSPEPMAIAPPEEPDPDAKQPPPAAPKKAPPKPRPPKSTNANSVVAAIFATVVIVLGLALLAVYAYIKQNK